MSKTLTSQEWAFVLQNVRNFMEKNRMTQEDFAEYLGETRVKTVSRWLNGHNQAKGLYLTNLLDKIGLTEEEVINRSAKKKKAYQKTAKKAAQ